MIDLVNDVNGDGNLSAFFFFLKCNFTWWHVFGACVCGTLLRIVFNFSVWLGYFDYENLDFS